jgi:signal peptidase II
MNKISLKKLYLNIIILITIFFIDRLTKIYILNLAEVEKSIDIYVTPYLNLYLVWNKGVAFGLFSLGEGMIYNFITFVIGIIILIIFFMMWQNNNIQRYFLILIAGGAIGNFYDRITYKAVPDFIDLHFEGSQWFVFNVADIFITIGVVSLILFEIFYMKDANDKQKKF